MDNIREHWDELWNLANLEEDKKKELFTELAKLYSENHRSYHNFSHILACLNYSKQVEDKIIDIVSFRFALFYHDAIYDTRAKDNEEKSALLAESKLIDAGLPEEKIQKVIHLILLTKSHSNPETEDDKIFLDIDLSILGESKDVFDMYDKAIREEYSWVATETYNKGRVEVLRKFLSRNRIYFSEYFYKKSEEKARINITSSLLLLGE